MNSTTMNHEQAKKIYENLFLIREAEQAIADVYPKGEIRCPTHLSIGQEAVPAAVGVATTSLDLAVSTHRCHAHYLGKGGSLRKMMAELYGKSTGCTRGRGGSMHLMDEAAGFMGSTAIVANSIPVGVGLALSLQLKRQQNVSLIFFGDGATEEGAFYEAANFATLRKLPALFLCENNLYSVYSSLKPRQPEGRKISELARSIGMKTEVVDGNDAEACFTAISEAKQRALAGEGAQFIEFFTYRLLEHCGPFVDQHLGYRPEEEFSKWKSVDPVALFREKLLQQKLLNEEQIQTIEKSIMTVIAEAMEFAKSSPFPDPSEAFGPIFKERATEAGGLK